jgi:hypothetical protein
METSTPAGVAPGGLGETETVAELPLTVTGPPLATLVREPSTTVTRRLAPPHAEAIPPTPTEVTFPPEVVYETVSPSVSQAETAVDPLPTADEFTPWSADADASEQSPIATAEQRMRRLFTQSLSRDPLPGAPSAGRAPPPGFGCYAIRMLTPSVSFAEGGVDVVTANEVAPLVGIERVPEPICAPLESVRLTLRVLPSQVSATPPTVTEVISYRLSVASQAVTYAAVTPSVSHEATTVLSAPTLSLVIPPRLAAMA